MGGAGVDERPGVGRQTHQFDDVELGPLVVFGQVDLHDQRRAQGQAPTITDDAASPPGRERVAYRDAGAASRRALAAVADGTVTGLDARVLAAVVWLTGTWSKVEDRPRLAQIAAMCVRVWGR